MEIRQMRLRDWPQVFAIYRQGIDSGKTTFSVHYPTWAEWDAEHHTTCSFVALEEDTVIGFTAISPTSSKPHYSGVVEVMVYVDEEHRRRGAGRALLSHLIEQAPKRGIWCLYSSIFSANVPSICLHEACGFRTVGYRERIAKDRFGNWTDTTLMEYRFPDEIVAT